MIPTITPVVLGPPDQVLDFRRLRDSIRRETMADIRKRHREHGEKLREHFRKYEELVGDATEAQVSEMIDALSGFERDARAAAERTLQEVARSKKLAIKHDDSMYALFAEIEAEFADENLELARLARDIRWKLAAARSEKVDQGSSPVVSSAKEYRLAYGKA